MRSCCPVLAGALSTLTRAEGWGRWGSNPRPRDYESPALTTELLPPAFALVTRHFLDFPAGFTIRIAFYEQGI